MNINLRVDRQGFAPIIIVIIVVVVIGIGAGGYFLLLQPQQDPGLLIGWWEDQGGFPFYREFTKNYICSQYDAKFHCVKNNRYTVSGDKLTYEGTAAKLSERWRVVDEKLEITQFSGGKQVGDVSIYKKVSEPTSPDRELPGPLEANLEFVKASASGICLRHNGGDIVYIGDIELTVDGKNVPISTFGQFPEFKDFLFSPGEALVLPGTFHVGTRISIKLARKILGTTPSFTPTESGSWTIDKLITETMPTTISPDTPFWYGFASCP